MMIALYSVGNVKRELKKIGRKLYIRDFAKFIFAYIEEDKLSLLTVQKITDDRWQIIHFYAEKIQKNNEDINLIGFAFQPPIEIGGYWYCILYATLLLRYSAT